VTDRNTPRAAHARISEGISSMSNKPEILGALRGASGPMTSSEVAEAIGQPATAVGRELYALAREGEIEQVDIEGKAAFLAGTGATTKRGAGRKPRKDKPVATAKREPKAKVAKKRAYTRRPRVERADQEHPQPAAAAAAPTGAELVHLSRGTLRALLAFVFASERPLDARTRTAAIDAAREAA
jgi:hypothetical protein